MSPVEVPEGDQPVGVVLAHGAGSAVGEMLSGDDRLAWLQPEPEEAGETLERLLPDEPGDAPRRRVAVVGIGALAGDAVDVAAEHGRVAALALVGPRLQAGHVDLVAEWPEMPVLGVADPSHRPGLSSAVDAFLASAHGGSDLLVGSVDGDMLGRATDWLAHRVEQSARVDEVVFESEDGWVLHGNRWLPERSRPVPGAVLLHTGRSDRAAYARLERLLAEAGIAVLNLEWRGRGQSTNLGSYFDLDSDVKAAAWRDALAALDQLAACPEVDENRLATVGVVHGAEYAARAAHRDPRVKAVVALTGYRPQEPEEAPHLTSGAVDVLYVTSTDQTITTTAMRELYEASSSPKTRFIEYPGAAIGYQLFELDPSLEPRIVDWLAEVLAP